MIDNILSVRNLSVTYKKNKRNIKVLHEINLDIKKGESLGIVGESGSGKTTICRSIIGAGPITTGEIFFENKPIRGRKNDCEKLIEEFIQSHEQLSENEMFFTRKLYRIVKTISNNAANKIIINSAEKMLQINNISVTVLNRLFEIVNSLHICQPKAKWSELLEDIYAILTFEKSINENLKLILAPEFTTAHVLEKTQIMINAHSIAIRKVKKLLSDFNSHIAKTTKSLKPVVPLNKKYVKKNMQIIFQDPSNSLNERMSVEDIIAEGIKNFKGELGIKTKEEVYKIVYKAIGQMGLLEEYGSRYVHELSGGQKQRVSIARSIALTPSFIIADEPISSLDVSIRAQILNLLKALQKKMKLTYLFVAHDLSVVRFFCDRICVMYKGRIVEIAPTEDLFKKPLHRYTKVLLNSAPVGELDKAGYEKNIEKTYVDKSTPFNPCVLKEVAKGHFVLLPYKKED